MWYRIAVGPHTSTGVIILSVVVALEHFKIFLVFKVSTGIAAVVVVARSVGRAVDLGDCMYYMIV